MVGRQLGELQEIVFELFNYRTRGSEIESKTITEPAVRNSDQETITEPVARNIHTFLLPWTHYLILMREKNPQARRFYEIKEKRICTITSTKSSK